ncbi:MAG: ribosome maturation factor RimP [Bacteroidota bacterium]
MPLNKQNLEKLFQSKIESLGAFLIEVSLRNSRDEKIVEIFIDTDKGATAGICADISRGISPLLNGLEEFAGNYQLIVSSPGIDKPLKFPRQYARNVGRNVSIKLNTGNGSDSIKGELLKVNSDFLVVQQEDEGTKEILFSEISEIYVIPRW